MTHPTTKNEVKATQKSLNDKALSIQRNIKAVIEKNRHVAFNDLPSLKK